MSIWGGVISAVGSVASGLLGKKSASDQMDFQRDMSNTAYQRSMADMKKAGLNPILAYQQGGASSPSGAGYSFENIGDAFVSSARETSVAKAQIEQMKADIDTKRTLSALQSAQEKLANSQNVASAAQARRDMASERLLNEQTIKTGFEALAAREQIATAKAEAGIRALELKAASHYGRSALGQQLEGVERGISRWWELGKGAYDTYIRKPKKGGSK